MTGLTVLLADATFAATPPARYLYVVTCDGRLDKVDFTARRLDRSIDLAFRARALLGAPSGGVTDGCVANGGVYSPPLHTVYTAMPAAMHEAASGSRPYIIVGFTIPGGDLTEHHAAPSASGDPPTLSVEHGRLLSTASPIKGPPLISLAGFIPSSLGTVEAEILETAGDKSLVRVGGGGAGGEDLAVIDGGSRRITLLKGVEDSGASTHLAGDGEAVIRAEGAGGSTGEIEVFSAKTGKLLRRLVAPSVKGFFYLGVGFNGVAVFQKAGDYRFVNLGQTCSSILVPRHYLVDDAGPWTFLADR